MGKLRDEWDRKVKPTLPDLAGIEKKYSEIFVGDRVYARVNVDYKNGCFLRGRAILFVVDIECPKDSTKVYVLNPVFIPSNDPASKVVKAATSYMNIWASESDIFGKVRIPDKKSSDGEVVCVAKMSKKVSEK